MNPKISITVDTKNKAIATITGMATVGADIDVEITGLPSGISDWATSDKFNGKSLRFRIVDELGNDIVRFPIVEKSSSSAIDGDQWQVISATESTPETYKSYNGTMISPVDFDTDKLRRAFVGVPFNDTLEFGLILDSIVDKAQYTTGRIKIRQWAVASSEDPTILPDWRKTLAELKTDLAAVTTAKNAATSARDTAVSAKEDAEDAANRAEAAIVHQPYIGDNGNWFVWNDSTTPPAYVDTGKKSKGADAAIGYVRYPSDKGGDDKWHKIYVGTDSDQNPSLVVDDTGETSPSNIYATEEELTAHTNSTTIHVTTANKDTWNGKQDKLISGTNIKTVNDVSLLITSTEDTNVSVREVPEITETSDQGKSLVVNNNDEANWDFVNYNNVTNKPKIASVELDGNKSFDDLGIQEKLTNPLTATDVKNNLTSTDVDKPLSANMGKSLKDAADTLSNTVATKITDPNNKAAGKVLKVASNGSDIIWGEEAAAPINYLVSVTKNDTEHSVSFTASNESLSKTITAGDFNALTPSSSLSSSNLTGEIDSGILPDASSSSKGAVKIEDTLSDDENIPTGSAVTAAIATETTRAIAKETEIMTLVSKLRDISWRVYLGDTIDNTFADTAGSISGTKITVTSTALVKWRSDGGVAGNAGQRGIYAPNVKHIKPFALNTTSDLKKIEIGEETSLGEGDNRNKVDDCAFYTTVTTVANLIENISMPNMQIIGRWAFYGHSRVKEADFNNVEEIGAYALTNFGTSNSNVFNWRLPKLTKIGDYAFGTSTATWNGSSDTFVANNLKIIGEHAFDHCASAASNPTGGLRIIEIPSIEYMGNLVFTNCYRLTDIYFGDRSAKNIPKIQDTGGTEYFPWGISSAIAPSCKFWGNDGYILYNDDGTGSTFVEGTYEPIED